MYTNFDLDLFKKLGNEKRISQIVEENFNNESEFYSWWNEKTNSNNELRTGLLIDNTKEFVLKREEHGIPRIQAESDEKMFFGLGMTMAHDRLFQLDYLRRKALGTLSEVMGEKCLDLDKVAKTMNFSSISKTEYNTMPDWSRNLLDHFTRGINHYIDIINNLLPSEFMILDYKPEKWKSEHSLAIMNEFRYYLTVRMPLLLMPEYARKHISDSDLLNIYTGGEADDESILYENEYKKGHNLGENFGGSTSSAEDGLGSNNWVVGPANSSTNFPILASDPHIAFGAVSCWYQIHMTGKSFDVMGMAYSGVPLIFMGRNKNVAWGITNNICSQRDLYYEKLNEENPDKYLHDQSYLNFEKRTEIIKIKNRKQIEFKIKSTVNGPIVNELLPQWVDLDTPISLSWLGFEYCSFVTDALNINKSNNAEEFLNSFQGWNVPTLSLVYGTVEGDFGYQAMGRIPYRDNHYKGIKPGWDPDFGWKGVIPKEGMPSLKNPERGWIGTANNRPANDDYQYPFFGTWSSGHRMRRIRKRLEGQTNVDFNLMKSIQYDMKSERAIECLPGLLMVIKNKNQFRNIYEILNNWDGDTNSESIAATIFEMFFNEWSFALTKEWFPENLVEHIYPSASAAANYLLRNEDTKGWIKSTSRSELIIGTMKKIITDLENKFGKDINKWKWGSLHKVYLNHPISIIGDLSLLYDRGGFSVGGTGVTVCNTGFDPNYLAPMGANLRLIADLNEDGMWIIDSQGVSGDPGSDFYCDQSEKWVNGDYIYLKFDN